MLSFRSFRSKSVRAANPEPEAPAASPRAREVAALATAARENLSAELPGQSERGEKINVVALMTEAAKLTAQVAEMATEIEKLKAGGESARTGSAASTAAPTAARARAFHGVALLRARSLAALRFAIGSDTSVF